MGITIWNLDNAFLAGEARYKRWERKFNQTFNQPLEDTKIQIAGRLWLQQQPPHVLEQLRAMKPEAFDRVMMGPAKNSGTGGRNGSR